MTYACLAGAALAPGRLRRDQRELAEHNAACANCKNANSAAPVVERLFARLPACPPLLG